MTRQCRCPAIRLTLIACLALFVLLTGTRADAATKRLGKAEHTIKVATLARTAAPGWTSFTR
jgi:hypothetical protein